MTAAPGTIVVGRTVEIGEPEGHHLNVRRAEDRIELRVVDGEGTVGFGRLGLQGEVSAVTIERVEQAPAPPETILAVGAGDRDRFTSLVEKAVELGVTRIVPLETAHSLSVANRIRAKHREKLVRRAHETLKQSGNPWLPLVAEPVALREFLSGHLPAGRWLADAEGNPAESLARDAGVVIAVGPEGGFTAEERASLVSSGFVPVRLGRHVLRFETAAIAALTIAWHTRQGGRHV